MYIFKQKAFSTSKHHKTWILLQFIWIIKILVERSDLVVECSLSTQSHYQIDSWHVLWLDLSNSSWNLQFVCTIHQCKAIYFTKVVSSYLSSLNLITFSYDIISSLPCSSTLKRYWTMSCIIVHDNKNWETPTYIKILVCVPPRSCLWYSSAPACDINCAQKNKTMSMAAIRNAVNFTNSHQRWVNLNDLKDWRAEGKKLVTTSQLYIS